MGFTKLDDGIIYSSVMGEDDSVFRVWIILLASCKSNGISPLSNIFIKNITGKSIEEINRCLKILSAPDINSRSKNDEGRRIRIVDGGFEIINYLKYRDFTYSDNPDAIRKREQRRRDILGHVPDILGHSASVSVSVSSSSERKEGIEGEKENSSSKKKLKKEFIPPIFEEFEKYCLENKHRNVSRRAFEGYAAADWYDSQGKKIKNWRQKLQHVWFRDDNKDPPTEAEKAIIQREKDLEMMREIEEERKLREGNKNGT